MKKALIGYGGHSREVMIQMGMTLPCFVDDKYVDKNTIPLSQFNPLEWEVMVCVGDPSIRKEIIDRLPNNTKYFTFIHPTALIGDDVKIGDGSFIGAYSVLTTNIEIGKHSLLNRSCHIGHDCVIDDYLSMMPGSILSGDVKIKDQVYIGTNSSVKEKISICNNVTIGLNTGVVKDINESGTYVGSPMKKIK